MLLLFGQSGGVSIDPGPVADLLRMSTIKLRLVDDQQISGLGGGKIIVHDLGPRYWEFDISLINLENPDDRKLQAVLDALDGGLGNFYLHDPRAAYPVADPTGVLLGSSTVQIHSLESDNQQLRFKGLPASYRVSPGDMFHFDFGTPTKRALHRVAVGGVAGSGGVTPLLKVRPHILPGAAVDAVVTLIRPSALVKIVPNSRNEGSGRGIMTAGASFKARQVLV